MLNFYQKTLSKKIIFKGIGLHSGRSSTVSLLPAEEDQGIVFKRIDLNKNNLVKANFANVSSARLCTTLKNNYDVSIIKNTYSNDKNSLQLIEQLFEYSGEKEIIPMGHSSGCTTLLNYCSKLKNVINVYY